MNKRIFKLVYRTERCRRVYVWWDIKQIRSKTKQLFVWTDAFSLTTRTSHDTQTTIRIVCMCASSCQFDAILLQKAIIHISKPIKVLAMCGESSITVAYLKRPSKSAISTLFTYIFEDFYTDPQTGVVTEANRNRNMRSRYRWSMCPANHINSRSLLRSSSTREPSDPPHRVVFCVNFAALYYVTRRNIRMQQCIN